MANRQPSSWRSTERRLWRAGYQRVAGVDEAGRGPLAGPVVAAACIVDRKAFVEGVDDSKKLARQKRVALFEELRGHACILAGIGIIDAATIDRINILQATIRAMWQALEAVEADYVVVDGRPIPHPSLPIEGVVGGDACVYPIAAASIIAKETRDRMMEEYHQQWPQYGFDQHKGYGTPQHLAALKEHGPCPIHRKSFRLIIRAVRLPH